MPPTDDLSHPTLLPITLPMVLPPVAAPAVAVETIRVLHVINGEHYAGAERVQDLLARRLPEFGFSAGFACVKLDQFDVMRESHETPLYDVSMRTKFDLWAALKVARIVRENGYRIIHGHTVRSALTGGLPAAMTTVPMVYHVHSPTTRDTTNRWRDRLNGIVERLSLRRASKVIAVSQALAEHVAREGFDPRRITVVPNGVPEVDTPSERPCPSGRWTLGVAALFRPRKGIEVLLEAMSILRRQGILPRLLAVGVFESPQYEVEIIELVRRLQLSEQIVWTGFTRDVPAELREMDLFVLPSLFGEGLPMVVLEAMAAGVPVVASRVAGVPEAIRHGRDGVLANPGDARDLALAIADVIEGRYNWSALRASALERHAECFSDRAMAEGVAEVYRDLLGG